MLDALLHKVAEGLFHFRTFALLHALQRRDLMVRCPRPKLLA